MSQSPIGRTRLLCPFCFEVVVSQKMPGSVANKITVFSRDDTRPDSGLGDSSLIARCSADVSLSPPLRQEHRVRCL